ncbi:MAG: YraN family protein [bacterium]|nr:YraN family protein [bacterium]
MYQPHQLGRWGEGKAEEYLKSKGYKILEKNFKRKWGELDIIASKKDVLVFIEVKTIKKPDKDEPFFPEDEINEKKAYQLRKMVQLYFDFKKISPETACQIDIIAIEQHSKDEKEFTLRHYENAFEDGF